VPALERLSSLRSSTPPINLEARRALEWLDEITSATANKSAGFVQLQGPDDQYTSWQEVEKYLLPETPLSALGGHESLDGINEAFARSLELRPRLSGEDERTGENGTSRSGSGRSTPAGGDHKKGKAHEGRLSKWVEKGACKRPASISDLFPGTSTIPTRFRPLLNFVVWRTYHSNYSLNSSTTHILLTNDVTMQKLASKFGVRAKLLNQVRNIVQKNMSQLDGTNEVPEVEENDDDVIDAVGDMKAVDERDEDEIVFVPPPRGSSQDLHAAPVIDPDHFGRNTSPGSRAAAISPVAPPLAPKSPALAQVFATQPKSQPSSPKPAQTTPASQHHRQNNSQHRSSPRAANMNGSMRGPRRDAQMPAQVTKLVKPIDPDSFTRPTNGIVRGGRGGGRGTGGRGRLWEPGT